MSSLIATVTQIEACDSLHIVKFDSNGQTLSMMSLDLNDAIQVGTKVKLAVKPSHIAIAKDFSGEVSYSNKLEATIVSCENGQLLSNIKLKFFDTDLESIITVDSSKRMNLKAGDKVTAFIKASEVSISEICDD
ncbi:TOBE domain-containing protein [Sulfurimonas sp.]|uniref:TOBE domain-containing protein n=1 Tax=Sulfurimonas sp. TaxID=2022749 RepID=UPI001A079B18|nr:TOBE domain-containing protein [Sulfurimonas sp.]MBE0514960.1 TOBE domain-containing protein [Sulfurimonas sp.]